MTKDPVVTLLTKRAKIMRQIVRTVRPANASQDIMRGPGGPFRRLRRRSPGGPLGRDFAIEVLDHINDRKDYDVLVSTLCHSRARCANNANY